MKIDKLEIRSRFKNLDNICIDFDEGHLMTVIVGQNGSGKSNILEALVSIFRNLDLGEPPIFSYFIRYKIGTGKKMNWVEIDADPVRGTIAKQYEIKVLKNGDNSDSASFTSIHKMKRDSSNNAPYLPKHLFAYYSGPSDRLENYFIKHRTDFYNKLLKNKVDLRGDIRPLFYAKPFHSQFVLLAFFLGNNTPKQQEFLKKHLSIDSLDSVHFVMRQPGWAKKKGELFWGASGVVRDFLDLLFPHTLSPIKINRREQVSLTGKGQSNEFMHLFLPDLESLQRFCQNLSPDELFKMLESTLLSEILSEVNVRVKLTTGTTLTFNELSEGEQQLLTVLGLLHFTGSADSLFLLDEPDTHLNPDWSIRYLEFLRDFVPNGDASHLLMVTHHPLTIADLKKEQVQVVRKDKNKVITAQSPEENPRGLGFSGILKSDMFGLISTLDKTTVDDLKKRDVLIAKKESGNLGINDRQKLDQLKENLSELGFSHEYRDPYYEKFMKVLLRVEGKPIEDLLSENELEKFEQLAEEFLDENIATERKRDVVEQMLKGLKEQPTK